MTNRAAHVASLLSAGVAAAQISAGVEWRLADGGNGHWYGVIRAPNGRWPESLQLARASNGTLATITSSTEDNFLQDHFEGILWIGLRRKPQNFSEFEWVTGEAVTYTRWVLPEPSGCNPCGQAFFVAWSRNSWDDTGYDVNGDPLHPGFSALIEFDADCDSDGLVDFGQIVRGERLDRDANNIPDACECATSPSLAICCISDLDLDGEVGTSDISLLLLSFGEQRRTAPAFDLDLNGIVDAGDIAMLLLDFGPCSRSMQASTPQAPPELLIREPAPSIRPQVDIPGAASPRIS